MRTVKEIIIKEWFFLLSLLSFLLTSVCFFRIPHYSIDDFKILFTLFVFLILTKGLEKSNFLKYLAIKVERGRFVPLKIVLFTAFISAFITNDVALIVIVPLTLLMKIPKLELLIVLEAMAANSGSALSPFGNPQNIFIYYHYNLHFKEFVETIFPFVFVSLILLILLTPKGKEKIKPMEEEVKYSRESYLLLFFFGTFILSVLKFIPLWVGILPIIYALFFNREILKINYFLLFTFFFFFGLTDNLVHTLNLRLENPTEVFLYSAIGSQIMSNVPATPFFADFTNQWKPLLWGVNVGGFGNLIGSLANLIVYKLYVEKFGNSKKIFIKFHVIGYLFFIVGILTFFITTNLK
ncbi:Citrate transporter [Desulfurobacterium thermolithotrophum DSM 11699]|uniref:Citrate transporter n=1 Tax=Desulfurobacterium thermolithotrophum (strain DSM 11699 / BSA) TaxID=868864 RepID=F0S1T1_DESTD|nr:SLC13 family permease [Desulfurobacterium thermolithotrophum]ADY72936.1 Citrate transporter [Desulfurobacterium thermolithotrophum DSM 11699]